MEKNLNDRLIESSDNIESKNPIPRRDFLKVLGALTGGIAACKKKLPTEPEVPEVPVSYTGNIHGLINDSNISSGQLIFDGTTKVDISNGVYTIGAGHNLREGEYNVRIETNEGITRETRANLSSGGLYQVKTGLPLNNVIEKNLIDINTYNDFITANGSERWLTNKPRFFLYDNTLFGKSADRSKLIVVDDDYTVNPTTISSIETTVKNHVSQYTDNFVSNPVLLKESTSSERPDPNNFPEGWIIYLIDRDAMYGIDQSKRPHNGDIYYGEMGILPGPTGIGAASIDTAQTLGIGQDKNSGQILTGLNPSTLAKKIAKIIYNRPPHHVLWGGVDKEL